MTSHRTKTEWFQSGVYGGPVYARTEEVELDGTKGEVAVVDDSFCNGLVVQDFKQQVSDEVGVAVAVEMRLKARHCSGAVSGC